MTPPRAVQVIQQLAAALNAAHEERAGAPRHQTLQRADDPRRACLPDRLRHRPRRRRDQNDPDRHDGRHICHTWRPNGSCAGTVDARADVYALTCVLHECLDRHKAFPWQQHGTADRGAPHRGSAQTQPPSTPPFQPGLIRVIARGMAKQPAERYQTAGELASAAQQALSAAPAPPAPQPSLVDDRRPLAPPSHHPPPLVRPSPPTMPGPPPRPVVGSPYQATDVAATQQAPPVGGLAAEPPNTAAAIGIGRFACVLSGVVLDRSRRPASLSLGETSTPGIACIPRTSWAC